MTQMRIATNIVAVLHPGNRRHRINAYKDQDSYKLFNQERCGFPNIDCLRFVYDYALQRGFVPADRCSY